MSQVEVSFLSQSVFEHNFEKQRLKSTVYFTCKIEVLFVFQTHYTVRNSTYSITVPPSPQAILKFTNKLLTGLFFLCCKNLTRYPLVHLPLRMATQICNFK